jgi:hypothetical protein
MVRAGSTMPERAARASPLAPAPDDPPRMPPTEPMVRMPELDALSGPPVLTDQPRPSDFTDVRTSTDRALERMARLRNGEMVNGHVPPAPEPGRAAPAFDPARAGLAGDPGRAAPSADQVRVAPPSDAGRAMSSSTHADARSGLGHGFPPLPNTEGRFEGGRTPMVDARPDASRAWPEEDRATPDGGRAMPDTGRATPDAARRLPPLPSRSIDDRDDPVHDFPTLSNSPVTRDDEARDFPPPVRVGTDRDPPARTSTDQHQPVRANTDREPPARANFDREEPPRVVPPLPLAGEGWGEGPPTHGSSAVAIEPPSRPEAFNSGGPDSLSPFTDQGPDTGLYFESAPSPITQRTLDATRGPDSRRPFEARGAETDRLRSLPPEPVLRNAHAPLSQPEPEPHISRELEVDYRDAFAPRAPDTPRARDLSREADTAFEVDFARMPPLPPTSSPRQAPEPRRESQADAVRQFRPSPPSNGQPFRTLDDDYTTGEPEAKLHIRPMKGASVDTIADSLAAARAAEHEELRQPAPRITVLSGASAGRSVLMERDEIVIGRVGLQVAAIDRVGSGYVLRLREGDATPILNGDRVPAVGATLKSGDIFEVAGARLEFLVHR